MYNYNYVIAMAKETIQIRVDEKTSRFVESLLVSGLFKTKSDAIRYLLSMGISATRKFSDVGEKVESLKRFEKSKGKFPIELSGGLKDLIDDRHRFK